MTPNRLSFRLLLPIALFAWGASGCDVNTCTGSKCEDLFPDGGLFGDMDGSMQADAASGDAGADASAGGGSNDGGPDTDAGSDGGTPAGITIAQFCDQQLAVGKAWADSFDNCCTGSTPAEASDFLSAVLIYPDNASTLCVDAREAPVTAGKTVYHADKAAACAQAYASQFDAPPTTCPTPGFDLVALEASIAHGAATLVQVPACREAFEGTVAQDGACDSAGKPDDFRCVPGLRCRTAPGNTLTCQSPVGDGGMCKRGGECADGLVCLSGVCRNPTNLAPNDNLGLNGASCASSRECVDGLVCNGSNKCATPPVSTPICAQ